MPIGMPALVPCHARASRCSKSGAGVLAATRLSPWSVEEGSDVEKSENRIVVLVIEDEALILDLIKEVLADLDVP